MNFMQTSMKEWKTNLKLYHASGIIKIPNILIKRGIFQRDSLSPLLFVLAPDPLSRLLKKMEKGYNTKNKNDHFIINHQLYMDDLKLYNSKEKKMKGQLKTVKDFSNDIRMEYGIDKCKKITIIKGKQHPMPDYIIDHETTIKEFDQDQKYKYLGISEAAGINHKIMITKLTKKYMYID